MKLPLLQHVLIADASVVEAIGIAGVLRRAANCKQITEVRDFPALLGALQPEIDLVLIDRELPGYSLPDIARLRHLASEAKLVLLSSTNGFDTITPWLAAGIRGFLPKGLEASELIQAIRAIASGQIFMPSSYWDAVALNGSGHETPTATHHLSVRQEQVLALASEGYSNKEIGAKLKIAESTVKVHISAVFRVLGVSSRGRAVAAFNAAKA